MSVATITETEAAEAILIDLADRAGVDRRTIRLALKISERTYYRRRRLPGDVLARQAEDEFTREEGGCV